MDLRTILANPMDLQFILTTSSNSSFDHGQSSFSIATASRLHIPSSHPAGSSSHNSRNGGQHKELHNENSTTQGQITNSALPLVWSNWNLLNEQLSCSPADVIVEKRRHKNRVIMRRWRRHRKALVVRMKETVVQLEHQRRALLLSRSRNSQRFHTKSLIINVVEPSDQ